MARRNLRKWAEAKQRRAEQHAPLRGHWIYSANGTGIFLEDPWPLFGTYCAPTEWLPMRADPDAPKQLFPDGVGEVLHALLDPEPQPGPPYTHTLRWPVTEYDEDGEPLPSRLEPSMTITRIVPGEPPVRAGLHPLLLDHGIDRTLRRPGHAEAPAGAGA